MAESKKTQTPNPLPADEQRGQPQVQFGIGAQYIKDFSFESPNAPHIFSPTDKGLELNLGLNVGMRAFGENTYEVVLSIKLEARLATKVAYIAELAYAGVFMVPPMPEDALKLILLVEGPRLLFPFARAILADAARDGGFPPMMLTPIDFMAHYQNNKGSLGLTAAVGAA